MQYVPIYPIQIRITKVWLIFFALLFVRNIFIVNESPELSSVVWGWFSTSILPTSGLIFGLWLSVMRNEHDDYRIPRIAANISQGIVYFYIISVLVSIAIQTIFGNKTPQEHYGESQAWLAIIQAPMLAFLGNVFAEKATGQSAENDS